MTIPNPNVRITLSDLAEYIKTSPGIDVLAFDTLHPNGGMPDFPLRFDALIITLCLQGKATVIIDMAEFHIKPGSLLVLNPNNFIQVTHCSEDFRSNTVMCAQNMVEQVLPKMTTMMPFIMQYRMMPVQQLTRKEVEGITSFYTFLKLKLEERKSPFQEQKVLCLLRAALYEVMDIRMAHTEDIMPRHHTRKEEIMARFILEVCQHFHTERQVSYYANKLCVTPKHLSAVVKEVSGRTAGEWIDHHVIMEAKMLLGSTDMTVQEISTQLNFANQSFFGKYFKHHTGIPPTEFRAMKNISAVATQPEPV